MNQVYPDFEITIKYSELSAIKIKLEETSIRCNSALGSYDEKDTYLRSNLEEVKDCLNSLHRKIDKLLPKIELDKKPF